MSIARMIAAHPDVRGNLNEPLATAVRHAMFCAAMCASCADACVAEEMDMRACIRRCLDCADICAATTRIAARRTSSDEALIQATLKLCIQACEHCAEECARHDTDHCRLCADMCRKCAGDCKAALETF